MFIPNGTLIHHDSQHTRQAPPNVRLVMYQDILF